MSRKYSFFKKTWQGLLLECQVHEENPLICMSEYFSVTLVSSRERFSKLFPVQVSMVPKAVNPETNVPHAWKYQKLKRRHLFLPSLTSRFTTDVMSGGVNPGKITTSLKQIVPNRHSCNLFPTPTYRNAPRRCRAKWSIAEAQTVLIDESRCSLPSSVRAICFNERLLAGWNLGTTQHASFSPSGSPGLIGGRSFYNLSWFEVPSVGKKLFRGLEGVYSLFVLKLYISFYPFCYVFWRNIFPP